MFRKMMPALAGWLALVMSLPAAAATVFEEAQVLAATPEAAAQLPPTYKFTLTAAGDYVVTLRDSGFPGPLQSLRALVTRELEVVAELEIDYPEPPDTTVLPVTQTFTGTPGTYRVHVLSPGATPESAGTFELGVARSSGGAAVFEVADEIAPDESPAEGRSVLEASFTIAATGTYQLSFNDRGFPAVLADRDILLRKRLNTTPNMTWETKLLDVGTFSANAGDTLDLHVFATAGASQAGLYGVTVVGGPTNAVVYRSENAVGQLPPAIDLNILAGGAHALTLTDLAFPEALTSFSAAVIQNNTFAGSVAGAGTASGSLPLTAGSAQLFIFAQTNTTGALSARLALGSQVDYADVHLFDASPDATTPAIYSFSPAQPVAAGSYLLSLVDFRFPSQLPSIHTAVVQGSTVVNTADEAGSEPVTLQAGPVRVLVAATPPPVSGTTPGNGMFALTLAAQPGGAVVVESTQGVGGLFTAMPINVPATGRYDVSLKDFEFPERLRSSWLAITRGTTLVGQVIGSSSIQNLQFDAGPIVLNFLGQPAQGASYGTFGMKIEDSVPPPVVTFSASPASVTSGQSTTLQWSATNATSCTAAGGWSGTKSVSGSQPTNTLTANTTFEIECVGPGGRDDASMTVSVNAPSPSRGGGGHVDPLMLVYMLTMAAIARMRQLRRGRLE